MIRFFNKITKTIIIVLGFLILAVITGIGAAGIYYEKQAQAFYSSTKKLAMDSLETANESIKSVQATLGDANTNLENTITSAKKALKDAGDSLEKIKNAATTSGAPTEDIEAAIASVNSLNSTIDDFGSFAKGIPSSMDDIVNSISSGEVYSTIQNIINSLPSDDEFNQSYNSISIGLTAAGGSVLGIYALSIILGFAFFKHTCGVRVRRFHKKTDLIKHVDKVFKKYPELYHEFYSNN